MNFKAEIYRKTFHLLSLAIPISYLFFTREQMIVCLSIATFIIASIDSIRFISVNANKIFMRFFSIILRVHEQKSISGATYLMASSLTVVLFFDRSIVITSILFAVFCDSIAALIGRRFGRIHLFNKTLEGSLSFFITGGIIAYVMEPAAPEPGFIGAFVAAVVELLPIDVDDNFLIPIVSAITIYLCRGIL